MDESRVAVLIDADNISGDNAEPVLEEAGLQGRVIIRRIYGDWTNTAGSKWKAVLASLAIDPVQQFANSKGKNATDSALIIDAMDLLHRSAADVFCIVSSDADFTRLATRLREDAKTVVGIGARKTPIAFVRACDRFIFLENLTRPPKGKERRAQREKQPQGRQERAPAPPEDLPDLTDLLDRAYDDVEREEGYAFLGSMGSALNKLDPSFDPRSYGHKKLRDLVSAAAGYAVDEPAGRGSLVVRRTDG